MACVTASIKSPVGGGIELPQNIPCLLRRQDSVIGGFGVKHMGLLIFLGALNIVQQHRHLDHRHIRAFRLPDTPGQGQHAQDMIEVVDRVAVVIERAGKLNRDRFHVSP